MNYFKWHEALIPYEQAVSELVAKINGISDEYKKRNFYSPIERVEGRVKDVASIFDKAKRKGIPIDQVFDKMEDIAGVRIVTRFVADIKIIIEQLKKRAGHDLDILVERDYIRERKPSGYQSYHLLCKYTVMNLEKPTVVWAEIQIRTLAMNFWAITEHMLNYKYSGDIPQNVQQRLMKSVEAAFNLDVEMSTIRDEITEAQKVEHIKKDMVDRILIKIQNLYQASKTEEANALNRQFFDIYQDCDIEELARFDNMLTTVSHINKTAY